MPEGSTDLLPVLEKRIPSTQKSLKYGSLSRNRKIEVITRGNTGMSPTTVSFQEKIPYGYLAYKSFYVTKVCVEYFGGTNKDIQIIFWPTEPEINQVAEINQA